MQFPLVCRGNPLALIRLPCMSLFHGSIPGRKANRYLSSTYVSPISHHGDFLSNAEICQLSTALSHFQHFLKSICPAHCKVTCLFCLFLFNILQESGCWTDGVAIVMSGTDLNTQSSSCSGKVGLLDKGSFQKFHHLEVSSSPLIWKLMENVRMFRKEIRCRRETLNWEYLPSWSNCVILER